MPKGEKKEEGKEKRNELYGATHHRLLSGVPVGDADARGPKAAPVD